MGYYILEVNFIWFQTPVQECYCQSTKRTSKENTEE